MKKGYHKSLALYEQPQAYSYRNHIASPDADQHVPIDFTSDPEVVRLVVEGCFCQVNYEPIFDRNVSLQKAKCLLT